MYLKKELYELIRTDESIFDFIQEGALDGMWYWDLENPENEYLNAKFWTVLGYNPDKMPHKSSAWQDIINKEDLEVVMENLTKHCENPNHPYDQIVRYTHKNGSTVWIRCRGFAIRDNNGKPIRMLGTHHDITELKQAEEKHALSERAYKEIFNGIDDSLFIHEIGTGAILDVNDSMLKNFGYDRDDIPKLNVADLSAHKEAYTNEHIGELIIKASKGETVVFEWLCRRKNGDFFYSENILKCVSIAGVERIMAIVRDITERKQAEKELKHSNNLMNYIIEHTRSAVAVHDRELRYIYTSQRYIDEYNVKNEDIIGKHHYDVFPDLPQKWRDVHQRSLAGEILSAEDDPYEREDGSVEWTRWECRPWYKEDGSIGGIIVYTEVITERKRMEETLRESEENLSITLQSIGDGVITTDKFGMIDKMNPVALKFCGWHEDEIKGKPLTVVFNIIDADTREPVPNPVEKVIENGEVVGLANHTVLIAKDGREYQIADSAAPIKDKDGNIKGIVLVFSDVSEKYAAEEEIRFQAHITANSPVITAYHDKELNMIWANKAYQKATGLSLEEIKGRKCYQVWNLSKPCSGCPVIKAIETGENASHELTSDNQEHWPETQGYWLSQATPMRDAQGAITGAIEFAIDITERKQAEQALLAKIDELERFHKLTVGRELSMIELKKEVNNLLKKLGENPKYKIVE